VIISQIFNSNSGVPSFNALAGGMLNSLAYISAAESIGVSSTAFRNSNRKLPNSAKLRGG